MTVDYNRTEETTTVVRYETRLPLDASTDVHMLLAHARRELNHLRNPENPKIDRDPGYRDLWIEHLGDTGEDSSRLAVCFRKVTVEEVEAPDPPEPSEVVERVLLDVIRARLLSPKWLDGRFPLTESNEQRIAYRMALDDFRAEVDKA